MKKARNAVRGKKIRFKKAQAETFKVSRTTLFKILHMKHVESKEFAKTKLGRPEREE
jgi:hypothetical protein